MVEYKGLHGTSEMRANSIIKNGFQIGKGRAGSGIYFWLENIYSINLAISWYKQLKSRNIFRDEKETKCAVITALLKSNENEVLDLEKIEFKNQIAQLATDKNINTNDNKSIAALYNLFITKLQEKLKIVFKILLLRVAPPDKRFYPDYPIKLIGAPISCVARDINVVNVEDVKIIEEKTNE